MPEVDESPDQEQLERVVIIIADYDSCFDALFEKHELNRIEAKRMLEEAISTISADELYVGSLRQSRRQDAKMASQNKNGSCFDNFRAYCTEKGIRLRTCLYADFYNRVEAGSSFYQHALDCPPFYEVDELPDGVDIDNEQQVAVIRKRDIVKSHLIDIQRNHPDKIVEIHFFDDRTKYLDDVLLLEAELPIHVSIQCHHFDWFGVNPIILKPYKEKIEYDWKAIILAAIAEYQQWREHKKESQRVTFSFKKLFFKTSGARAEKLEKLLQKRDVSLAAVEAYIARIREKTHIKKGEQSLAHFLELALAKIKAVADRPLNLDEMRVKPSVAKRRPVRRIVICG